MNKDLVHAKKEIKCINIKKQYKNIQHLLYYITQEDIKEHNSNLPQIPDHPYRILIVGRKDPEDLEKQMHY